MSSNKASHTDSGWMLCWSDKAGNVGCNNECLDAYDNKLKREFALAANKELVLTRMAPCSPLLPMFIDRYMNIRQTKRAFDGYNNMIRNIRRTATNTER